MSVAHAFCLPLLPLVSCRVLTFNPVSHTPDPLGPCDPRCHCGLALPAFHSCYGDLHLAGFYTADRHLCVPSQPNACLSRGELGSFLVLTWAHRPSETLMFSPWETSGGSEVPEIVGQVCAPVGGRLCCGLPMVVPVNPLGFRQILEVSFLLLTIGLSFGVTSRPLGS